MAWHQTGDKPLPIPIMMISNAILYKRHNGLTLMLNLLQETWRHIHISIISLRWHRLLKSLLVEDKDLFILHGQYHGGQWPNDTRSQGISSLGVDLAIPQYSGFSTWRVNSFGPSNAIWWLRCGSTLAQVMACCLTAPSHYLNQCWFLISEVLWHSLESNFARSAHELNP